MNWLLTGVVKIVLMKIIGGALATALHRVRATKKKDVRFRMSQTTTQKYLWRRYAHNS